MSHSVNGQPDRALWGSALDGVLLTVEARLDAVSKARPA